MPIDVAVIAALTREDVQMAMERAREAWRWVGRDQAGNPARNSDAGFATAWRESDAPSRPP